ncbi:MAG TPA: hypothetical protein VGS21_05185, partial [Acidimicrobiales bacterium]|nr:hypothetical protein [Acidimicrobiales bacterium]
ASGFLSLPSGNGAAGLAIGWQSPQISSVTVFRMGKGSIVLFDSPTTDDDAISFDVSMILISGAYAAQGTAAVEAVPLTSLGAGVRATLSFDPSGIGATSLTTIRLLVMDPDPLGTLATAFDLPASDG